MERISRPAKVPVTQGSVLRRCLLVNRINFGAVGADEFEVLADGLAVAGGN